MRHASRLKGVVLDWAGTIVDHGSLAPVHTLIRLFESTGIRITEPEARRDMGLPKKDHIAAILRAPRVIEAWAARNGHPPSIADLDALYASFIPLQFSCLEEFSTLIPGVAEAADRMRARGLKIGTSTGYTRAMLEVVLAKAAAQGFIPDASVVPEEVGSGRPGPYMAVLNAVRMHVWPMESMVKVGDTIADIEEGLNAGMWAVGVAATGNMIGLSQASFDALEETERDRRLEAARSLLLEAGAHFVIDGVAEIDAVLDAIDERLSTGAHPWKN